MDHDPLQEFLKLPGNANLCWEHSFSEADLREGCRGATAPLFSCLVKKRPTVRADIAFSFGPNFFAPSPSPSKIR